MCPFTRRSVFLNLTATPSYAPIPVRVPTPAPSSSGETRKLPELISGQKTGPSARILAPFGIAVPFKPPPPPVRPPSLFEIAATFGAICTRRRRARSRLAVSTGADFVGCRKGRG